MIGISRLGGHTDGSYRGRLTAPQDRQPLGRRRTMATWSGIRLARLNLFGSCVHRDPGGRGDLAECAAWDCGRAALIPQ